MKKTQASSLFSDSDHVANALKGALVGMEYQGENACAVLSGIAADFGKKIYCSTPDQGRDQAATFFDQYKPQI